MTRSNLLGALGLVLVTASMVQAFPLSVQPVDRAGEIRRPAAAVDRAPRAVSAPLVEKSLLAVPVVPIEIPGFGEFGAGAPPEADDEAVSPLLGAPVRQEAPEAPGRR